MDPTSHVSDAAFALHQGIARAMHDILMAHSYGSHDAFNRAIARLEVACLEARAIMAAAAKKERAA